MTEDRLAAELRRLQELLAEASQVSARIATLCLGKRSEGPGAALSTTVSAAAGAVAPVVKRRQSRAASSAPQEERREEPRPSAEERARALSAEVSLEGRALSGTLRGEAELAARVAWWAGRARALLLELGETEWRMRELVERVLAELFDLARRHDLEGIEALDRRWSIDDFQIYCAYQRHLFEGTPLELSEQEQQVLWSALVRALLLPGRPVSGSKAGKVLSEAVACLGAEHPLVAEARERYADKLDRAPKSASVSSASAPAPSSTRSPASTRSPVSTRSPASTGSPPPSSSRPALESSRTGVASVVALTRGRRAFLLGGAYAHPNQQTEIQQQFKFSKFKWLTAKSGSADTLARLAAAIGPGAYDVAFLLPDAEAEELRVLVQACETAEIPIVRLSAEYDEASFSSAALGFFEAQLQAEEDARGRTLRSQSRGRFN